MKSYTMTSNAADSVREVAAKLKALALALAEAKAEAEAMSMSNTNGHPGTPAEPKMAGTRRGAVIVSCIELIKNLDILEKLIFLNNNLMQYHSVSYNEYLYRFTDTKRKTRDIIIFKATEPIAEPLVALQQIIGMIEQYISSGYITKSHMKAANDMWETLKKVADIYTEG